MTSIFCHVNECGYSRLPSVSVNINTHNLIYVLTSKLVTYVLIFEILYA